MADLRCSTCGELRPPSMFSKHRSGLSASCKLCRRAYARRHYEANRAEYIARARAATDRRRDENALKLLAYFACHPCVDCAESDPVVLQFDHRQDKEQDISRLLSLGAPWSLIVDEVRRCEVRCANCHRRRHARDRRMLEALRALPVVLAPAGSPSGIRTRESPP
jgi:hypothetical protein